MTDYDCFCCPGCGTRIGTTVSSGGVIVATITLTLAAPNAETTLLRTPMTAGERQRWLAAAAAGGD